VKLRTGSTKRWRGDRFRPGGILLKGKRKGVGCAEENVLWRSPTSKAHGKEVAMKKTFRENEGRSIHRGLTMPMGESLSKKKREGPKGA